MSKNKGERVYLIFNGIAPVLLDGIAQEFQNKHKIEAIRATVASDDIANFLKRESPINYEYIHQESEVHDEWVPTVADQDRLQDIEEKYGFPFIYKYLLADKNLVSYPHRSQKQILQGWFNFYENIFRQFNPDVLLTNRIDSTAVMVAYELVQSFGATAIWWKGTRVGNQHAVLENTPYDDLTGVYKLYQEFQSGEQSVENFPESLSAAEDYYSEFQKSGVKPGYFERRENTFRSPIQMSQRLLKRVFRAKSHFGPTSLVKVITDATKRSYVASRYTESPRSGEDFVYFPLQAQPEDSTSVLAPMYLNQAALVEQVSRSLPITHKLYVKEHPRMLRDNPRALQKYRQIASLPNVRLIEIGADSHSLVKNSDVVVTPTGTPAFEAVLLNKPAVTFGKAHFNVLEGVSKCQNISNLTSVMNTALQEYEPNEREIIQYLTAIYARSVELPSDIFGLTTDQESQASKLLYRLINYHLD